MTKRWRIFAVFAVMYLVAYFYRVSMAVIARDLAADLALDASRIGMLSGALFYAFALAQIPLGPLLDRFGGRIVVSLAGLVTVAGSFTFALAPGYGALLGGRILIGMGTACVLMGALKVFTTWFSSREYATISGLIIAVGNVGISAPRPPWPWRSPWGGGALPSWWWAPFNWGLPCSSSGSCGIGRQPARGWRKSRFWPRPTGRWGHWRGGASCSLVPLSGSWPSFRFSGTPATWLSRDSGAGRGSWR